jgi:hypothetical protein
MPIVMELVSQPWRRFVVALPMEERKRFTGFPP